MSNNDSNSIDYIIQNNPQLLGHYCYDCPIYLTSNYNPQRGLANGTAANMYDIIWLTSEIENDALQFIANNSNNNNYHIMLPDHLIPYRILFRPQLRQNLIDNWPDNITLVNNDQILPIDVCNECYKIRLMNTSKKYVIILQKMQYEIGFMKTVHGVQGLTIPKVIFSFLKRPQKPSGRDFHSVYVMITRISDPNSFRVIADINDLDFLDNLKPPTHLIAMLEGYDENGIWDRNKAEHTLNNLLYEQNHDNNNNNIRKYNSNIRRNNSSSSSSSNE